MTKIELVIGNKNYSSWSLRGWLALRMSGAQFDEILVPLDRPETRAAIAAHSPTGLVPLLKCGDEVVWDSLAIAEWSAERYPEAGLWPSNPAARAVARSVCAEMHSGFSALRGEFPMSIRREEQGRAFSSETQKDIERICELWTFCREKFGQDGPFLFGSASIADAFFAPVVSRFRTYRVQLEGPTKDYAQTILEWPLFQEWIAAAHEEPFKIGKYEE
ncbi:MAG: glutathione S-transferase family protein [Alphaproteobacteria bacterium]|nr:glutathione S-transferase family protein [Alphaproteobacteria bacterium]